MRFAQSGADEHGFREASATAPRAKDVNGATAMHPGDVAAAAEEFLGTPNQRRYEPAGGIDMNSPEMLDEDPFQAEKLLEKKGLKNFDPAYSTVMNDRGLRKAAGMEDGDDSEEWDEDVRLPRNMPVWMAYDIAMSEEEELPEYTGEAATKAHIDHAMIRPYMRDAEGWATAKGGRKTAFSQVSVRLGDGRFEINGKELVDYFGHDTDRSKSLLPLVLLRACGAFDVVARVKGGGSSGQAVAVQNGLARALIRFDPELRPKLQAEGLLHRDTRSVERKKFGQKKARKKFTWVKR